MAQDFVHAGEAHTSANMRVIIVSHGMEERYTIAFFQNFIIGGSKETIGQAISGKYKKIAV